MSKNVFANGREISAKNDDNKATASMPDVCLSPPSPPAGPVPLPYPNTAMASDTSDGSKTVKIGGARILMSSWEVTAFVTEGGPTAEDLRRAVVARAMVTVALETAKETGNATSLERALTVARVEVTRLQERVDIAKQTKDTEAAVNLGISTKRLLSALDEAEKL